MIAAQGGTLCLTPTCSDHFLPPTNYFIKKQDIQIIGHIAQQTGIVQLTPNQATRVLEWHEHLWKLAIKYKALEEKLESLKRR